MVLDDSGSKQHRSHGMNSTDPYKAKGPARVLLFIKLFVSALKARISTHTTKSGVVGNCGRSLRCRESKNVHTYKNAPLSIVFSEIDTVVLRINNEKWPNIEKYRASIVL